MKDKQMEILNLVYRLRNAPAYLVQAYTDQILEAIQGLDQIHNVPTKPARRHLRVLDALNESGGATVEHLAGMLRLAPPTVRLYLSEIRELNLAPVENYANRWWLNWEETAGNPPAHH